MVYIADIPVNTRVWLNKPETGIPARKGDRGRIPTKERVLEGEPDLIEAPQPGRRAQITQIKIGTARFFRDVSKRSR